MAPTVTCCLRDLGGGEGGGAHYILLWLVTTPQGALGAAGGCCSIWLHGNGVSGAAGNILTAQGGCIGTGPV